MHPDRLLGHLEDADAADLLAVPRKYFDQRLLQADRLEQLGAAIGHVGRHAHLRHDLRQTLADRLM
jgi:hypothetical protein